MPQVFGRYNQEQAQFRYALDFEISFFSHAKYFFVSANPGKTF